jgi:hypothetical protein
VGRFDGIERMFLLGSPKPRCAHDLSHNQHRVRQPAPVPNLCPQRSRPRHRAGEDPLDSLCLGGTRTISQPVRADVGIPPSVGAKPRARPTQAASTGSSKLPPGSTNFGGPFEARIANVSAPGPRTPADASIVVQRLRIAGEQRGVLPTMGGGCFANPEAPVKPRRHSLI